MDVGIDEPGEDSRSGSIDYLGGVRGQIGADLVNPSVADQNIRKDRSRSHTVNQPAAADKQIRAPRVLGHSDERECGHPQPPGP